MYTVGCGYNTVNKAEKERVGSQLADAIHRGNAGEVQRLLVAANGAHAVVNSQLECFDRAWERGTALHLAARVAKADVVTQLLRAKASVNDLNPKGCSPLFLACRWGHSEVAQVLLDAGADVNAVTKGGRAPLFACSMGGNHDLVSLLLEARAAVNHADPWGYTAAMGASQHGRDASLPSLLLPLP